MTTEKGTLIRWIENKGFGFTKPDKGGNDLFIHVTALKTMSRKPVRGMSFIIESMWTILAKRVQWTQKSNFG